MRGRGIEAHSSTPFRRASWMLLSGLIVGFAPLPPVAAQEDQAQVVRPLIRIQPNRQGAIVFGQAEQQDDPVAERGLAKDLWRLIQVELAFAERILQLDADQLKQLKEALRPASSEQTDLLNERNVQGRPVINQGAFQVAAGAAPNGTTVAAQTSSGHALSGNPLQRVNRMVREAIGEIIGQPQQARLEQAQRRRDAFRREANVLVVVSLLDEPLALSAEQRQQLTETLREQWEAAELFAAEHYLMNQEYVPNLPARLLKDVLTTEQRRVWNSLQQVTFTMQISPPQQEQWND